MNFRNFKNLKAGFTIVELLIVMSITATLAALGTVSYNNAIKKDQLRSFTQEIISQLEDARTKAVNQEDGLSWGVVFEASSTPTLSDYKMFRDETTPTFINIKKLSSGITFKSPIPNTPSGIETIIFNKSSGTLKDNINHLISLTDGYDETNIYINKNGLISLGLPASVVGLSAPTLISPTDGAVIGLVSSQNLVWNAVTGAQTYRLQVSTDSNFSSIFFENNSITGTGDTINYTVTNLQPYTTYYWRVNDYSLLTGNSLWSIIRSVGTLTAPGAPVSPSGSPANGMNILAWSVPTTNGGSSISGYKIYWGTVSGNLPNTINPGNVLTYNHVGLTNGTTYYYKVAAINGVGEGTQTSEFSATPQPPPTAGTLTITPSAASYIPGTVTLSAPFTSNVTVTGCEYTLNGGANWYVSTLSGSIPNYTCTQSNITGFVDGSSYTLNMRATNGAGTTTATAATRTGDTVGPTVTDNWTNNWTATTPVTVTLTPTDAKSGVASTKYCVDTANTCTPSTVGTSVSVTCAAGTVCTQYVRYAAWDYVGNASAIYSETVRQDTMAPVDGTLIVTPGSYQNSLSWSGFSDSGSGLAAANTYKVVYLTTGIPAASCTTGTQVYLGTGTSTIHTGLTGGATYYYRVCAYDALGNISTGATNSGIPTTTTTTTQPAGSTWVLNSASGQNCDTKCAAISLLCAGISSVNGGPANATYYNSLCRPIFATGSGCTNVMTVTSTSCSGNLAYWTYCECNTVGATTTTTTCVLAGTKIDMADGSKKSIEDIKVGDMVLSYNEQTGKNEPNKVIRAFHHTIEEMSGNYYLIINGSLKITPNHHVMINGSWNMPIGDVRIGDKLQLVNGNTLIVYSIQKVENRVPTYNLGLNVIHNYYADGILVHNVIK